MKLSEHNKTRLLYGGQNLLWFEVCKDLPIRSANLMDKVFFSELEVSSNDDLVKSFL